jgi:hypothetical protein
MVFGSNTSSVLFQNSIPNSIGHFCFSALENSETIIPRADGRRPGAILFLLRQRRQPNIDLTCKGELARILRQDFKQNP